MNLDPEKLLTLFVIGLVVLGPQRLPQVARVLGRGFAELKKYRSMLTSEVNGLLEEPRSAMGGALSEVRAVRDAAIDEMHAAADGALGDVRSARDRTVAELRGTRGSVPAWEAGNGSGPQAPLPLLPGGAAAPDDPSLN